MASNWIKLEVITPDKPEIFRLAEILNIDPDAALGKVIRFWAWADQQMIDGNAECNARGVTKSAIDRITFMAGFADALIQVGWLVETNGVLSLPNFERHNGKSSKKRAVTNERVTKIRELKRKGNAASVTKTDQKALPEEEKEEDINTISIFERDTSKEYIGNYKLCTGYRKLHPTILSYTDYGYLQITINEIINGTLDLIHIR